MAWLADPAYRSRVLVFGCGAFGTVIAYFFTKAGYEVTRSCFEAAAAPQNPYDIVVVASKAVLSTDTAATIAPVIEPRQTTILLVQNGVGIEADYLEKFPENQILSAVAYCFATQLVPGRTFMAGKAKLEIRPYPEPLRNETVSLSTQTMAARLDDAGLAVAWHDDIQERRWLKLVLNAPYNSMCALTRSDSGAILSGTGPLAMDVMHGVMDEIVATANALGYDGVKRGIR